MLLFILCLYAVPLYTLKIVSAGYRWRHRPTVDKISSRTTAVNELCSSSGTPFTAGN